MREISRTFCMRKGDNISLQNAIDLTGLKQVSKIKPIGEPKRTIKLLKRLSKQSMKMLWKDFQIELNYLKII